MIDRSIATPFQTNRRRGAFGQWLRENRRPDVIRISSLLAAHVTLGLLLRSVPLLATIHAGAVLLIGIWYALSTTRIERAAYLGAYITGSEVLWRMTTTSLFWELGKYAVVAIFILALIRTGRLKGPILPFLFLLLLLPSLVMPMANVEGSDMRNQISFNMSGPLALVISTWFFSHVRLTVAQLQRLFLALICPIISIATIALSGILTAEKLVFMTESNKMTSGGYGPVQVSAMLGLGALTAFLLILDRSIPRSLRVVFFFVAILLTAQSALTFSRSGLYMACGGAIPAVILLIQNKRARLRLFAAIIALFLAVNFILISKLDDFTGGTLSKRFSDTELTGRDKLALADLEIFTKNPVFGVGPGETPHHRNPEITKSSASAHTEFSRLLAEHGVFGLTAIFLLLCMALQHFRQSPTAEGKALAGSMTAWSMLFMASIAMRLVAPAFVFGMTAATILPDNGPEHPNARSIG